MPARIGDEPAHLKTARAGDCVVMVGGRIGKDGIHGATFSSVELDEASPASAVQIGDAITQKNMFDMLLEARDRQLYRCITDNGAGGLSSSVGEMAQFSNGCELHLERAPLKYPGLDPWEILVSESQERMTLAVPPERLEAFLALSARREVEATVLGTGSPTRASSTCATTALPLPCWRWRFCTTACRKCASRLAGSRPDLTSRHG